MTAMGAVDRYREQLRALDDWDAYLLAESRLPGPRANLELARAAAEEGTADQFERWLQYGPEQADVNSPHAFLAFCGAIGLGTLLVQGQLDHLPRLRELASDPRWRMREAVAMALQRYGRSDIEGLLDAMESWCKGNRYEQRAAAAAVCEPVLLQDEAVASHVLQLLDRITGSMQEAPDRRSEGFKALRKGMGYCWSVAVVALPSAGMPLFQRWLASRDPDIRWLVRSNLQKKRLQRLDHNWVASCLAAL